jgi:putative aldouronate transport system substrate-binding protein
MKKRILALLVVVFIVTSLFAGCNKAGKTNDTNSTNDTNTTDTADTTGTADSTTENKEITWYLDASWLPSEWGQDWVTQEITKQTGFNVKLIIPPANDNGVKLAQMIASNDLPDIITTWCYNTNIPQMISNKMIAPINQLADQYDKEFYNYADKDILIWNQKDDGNVYAYNDYTCSPADLINDPLVVPHDTFMVRKDIYEAIGKPDMTTQEGFADALRKAKEYMPDTDAGPLIPFAVQPFNAANDVNGSTGLGYILADFLAVPYITDDGKINDRFSDPTYLSWLKFISHLSQEGLFPADVVAQSHDQDSTNIENGRYFAWMGQAVDKTGVLQSWYAKDPNKAYIAVMGPQNANHDAPVMPAGTPAGWMSNMISANSKNKETAIKFLTYMMSPEAIKLQLVGIEGKSYTSDADGKVTLTKEYKDMLQNDPNNVSTITGIGNWAFMTQSRDNDQYMYAFSDTSKSYSLVTDMYKQYMYYNGAMEFTPFDAESPASKAQSQCNTLWDTTLPQLVRAASDKEFDSILASFYEQRDAAGYQDLVAAQQEQLTKNLAKIEQFPDNPNK